jgi:hypothetical protein
MNKQNNKNELNQHLINVFKTYNYNHQSMGPQEMVLIGYWNQSYLKLQEPNY